MTKKTLASLLLQLIIGPGFIVHGWVKLSRGGSGFEKLLASQGVPLSHLNAVVAPYIELLGGIAILLGAFVVIAALLLIFTMLVATIYVQGHYGFSSVNTIGVTVNGPQFGPPGYEINLLYIAGLLCLMILGTGDLSIDALRKKQKEKKALAISRLQRR